MKNYAALLLDLDDTLYDYNKAHSAGLTNLYAVIHQQTSILPAQAEMVFNQAREKINYQLQGTAASHNRLLYIQGLCELLHLNPAKYSLAFYDAYWDTFLANMRFYPEVKNFLDRWLMLGKRICLLTDLTAHIQYRKIAVLQLENYFSYIVTSEEVGHDKPHPLMFQTALNKLQLTAEQVIMLGDNYEKDFMGAQNLGIAALHFSPIADINNPISSVNFNALLEMLT